MLSMVVQTEARTRISCGHVQEFYVHCEINYTSDSHKHLALTCVHRELAHVTGELRESSTWAAPRRQQLSANSNVLPILHLLAKT